MRITSGAGKSYEAEVDYHLRLLTKSTTISGLHFNSEEEELSFDFSSGDFINLTTTGVEHGVFYLKNISTTRNLHIHTVRTCADQQHKVKIYKNPTSGTLISNAVAGISTNLNFGSSKLAEASVFSGVNGDTLTGDVMTQHINNVGHSTARIEGALILPPEKSIGFTCEVAVAADFCIRIVGHYS